MARKKYTNRLIDKDEINEELRLIDGSDRDYITPNGNVYSLYEDGKYFIKKPYLNKKNGYLYIGIHTVSGNKSFRLHRLVAKAFLPNPNNLPVVMHIDNDKANPKLSNLKWGTGSENTQDAFNDGLARNDKGFKDSQSFPVAQFDLDGVFIKSYGSTSIASELTGLTKTGILYQCKHKMKTKPRCGYYFRFLDEYKKYGFVL